MLDAPPLLELPPVPGVEPAPTELEPVPALALVKPPLFTEPAAPGEPIPSAPPVCELPAVPGKPSSALSPQAATVMAERRTAEPTEIRR